MYRVNIFCLLSILLSLVTTSHGELFTAISDVEPLLETHKKIIDDLEDYIKKEEDRLQALKRHLVIYRREHEQAMEDIPNYLGNPINAFTLIKRLTIDLDDIEKSIEIGTEYIKNITIINNHANVKYPTLEDLTGAAQALTRLQQTYKLDVKDLSEGRLNGVVY
ncbi:prolyl 4-hydroxylase alpha subunit precursor, partial [Danaus plexippus plexippus]